MNQEHAKPGDRIVITIKSEYYRVSRGKKGWKLFSLRLGRTQWRNSTRSRRRGL